MVFPRREDTLVDSSFYTFLTKKVPFFEDVFPPEGGHLSRLLLLFIQAISVFPRLSMMVSFK